MAPSPRISVVIPTLNEEKLIQQTLSQFTPELRNKYSIQLIVSDGGSTDLTLQRIGRSADVLIKAAEGERQNIPIGRNAGAKKAEGDILYFFNADTFIENIDKFFETTIRFFEDDNILACTCKIRIFPDEEMLKDKLFHAAYNTYVSILNKIGMGMGRGECHIVRKQIFEKVNGYNESMSAGEDYDLFRRIRKLGKIKFLGGLTVYESPRRYRKFGYLKVFGDWTRNSLSVFFRNKSVSSEWEAVR